MAGGRHAGADEGLTPRLELKGVSKRYAGTLANDNVSLCIGHGRIHAVLGENGAGKSTLMKIIGGALQADSGEMLWQGEPVKMASPAAARRLGIGMVHQHFSLFETVTVAENIAVALDEEFDLTALAGKIRELGGRYGLHVEPHRLLHHLSVGERQRVEILRALLQDPKLLILDEPTSVLAPQAATRLFGVLRMLAAAGCSILYVTHKLDEVRELCDSATILRQGRVVALADPKQVDSAGLARLMVGAALPAVRRTGCSREPIARLRAVALSTRPPDAFATALRDISLEVCGGEIVGIAGVSGNGQSELASALSGETTGRADAVLFDGEPVGHLTVAARRARGLACVPEERLGRGAVARMPLTDNTLLTAHAMGLIRGGLIRRARVGALARSIIERFGIKCAGSSAPAQSLSGGNLQKFIVGREVSLSPRVLIASQPTWGVDVAAAAYLRQSLIDLSRSGAALLVFSEELDELLEICDRIAVIHQGRLSAAKPCTGAHLEHIGLAMAGIGPAFQSAA